MKYIAKVKQVLHPNIHRIGTFEGDKLKTVEYFPNAERVEIEIEADEDSPCMMYRYTNSGKFCGDTWHETFQDALDEALREYGLKREDFIKSKD
jgi:hypothetical protein